MRVVIADDSALVRAGLVAMLAEAGIEVLAESTDTADLYVAVAQTRPDAAIIDIRMPPTFRIEGIEAAHTLRDRHPDVAVLLLSQYTESSYVMSLIEDNPAGRGYLLKQGIASGTTLSDALHRVVAGETVIDPALVRRMLARARRPDPLHALTPREREVLGLMAEGRSNASIGELLGMGIKTVETHVGRVFVKLGLAEDAAGHRRVLAVLAYLRQG
jgi:DNA-binding NarL/FixJ family response regulator